MSSDMIRVIDFHGHVGRWDAYGMADDPARMLAAMDAVGIDQTAVFNIFHADSRVGNDATAAFIARHPERFIGFAYVVPTLPPEAIEAELTRCVDRLGFRAIKLYPPYMPWPLHDEHWYPIYAFAQARGLAVLLHTGTESHALPRYLSEIAPRFPGANFVAGHSGTIDPPRKEAIAAARACPNVYLETCSSFRTPGVIEELVGRAGADRVLFGSDTPLMDPRCQLGKIITADISDAAKRLVLGEHARRPLFGDRHHKLAQHRLKTGVPRSPAHRVGWRVADPPKTFISGWLWGGGRPQNPPPGLPINKI
jgi:predicted TIM-barrel fold metal-dependent hydrolase